MKKENYKYLDYAESEILLKETIEHVLDLLRYEKDPTVKEEEEKYEFHEKLKHFNLDSFKLEYFFFLIDKYYRAEQTYDDEIRDKLYHIDKMDKSDAKFENLPREFLKHFIDLVNELIPILNLSENQKKYFYYTEQIEEMAEFIKILEKRFKLLENKKK